MARKKFPCKNHPERLSVRKCFQCSRYICPECQNHFFHHLFCGYWCTLKYLWTTWILPKSKYRDYAVLLLIALLSQILLIAIFFPDRAGKDERFSPENDNELSTAERRLSVQESSFTLDTLYSQPARALIISGTGPPNTLFGLWQNGRFLSAAVSDGGHYQFPGQILSLGSNTFHVWALSDHGKTTLVDSFAVAFRSRRLEFLAEPFDKAVTSKKIIALTFDGGSLATGADSILSILNEKHVRSTFFLTGAFIQNFPGIVKRMAGLGHELGNHTFSHPHLTSFESNGTHQTRPDVNRERVFNQLTKTDSLLYAVLQIHFKPYWRAPFGEYNQSILLWAAEAGYKHIGWSKGGDTRDWVTDKESPLYRSAGQIYDYLMELESRDRLRGAVVLMHLHSDREDERPYEILPDLIDELQKRGYQLMTVSDLIRAASAI